MERYGITVQLKHTPVLDPEFMPIGLFNKAFLKGASKPVAFAVERSCGQMAVTRTFIHGTAEMAAAAFLSFASLS